MAKYLSGQRLLALNDAMGSDLDSLDDVALESLCAQASAIVDSYCLVPRAPQMHDLKGGTITAEVHEWRYPSSAFDIGQRRVYVMHRPLTAISQLRIYVSRQPIYLEIAPEHLVINPSSGYADIVALALTTSGLFNALIVPNVGALSPIVEINYTYGSTFGVIGEVLLETDALTFRAENQFWTADDPVVYKNGTIVTTGITLDRTEGTVTFTDPLTASDVITADYIHRLPNSVMHATAYIAAFLRSGAKNRKRGMERLGSIAVAEVKITRAPAVSIENIDELVPEAAMLLADYRSDGLVVR